MQPKSSALELAHKKDLFLKTHNIKNNAIIFMYSGNWNRTVSLLPLARACASLLVEKMHLVLAGSGSGRPEVEAFMANKNPKNITLLPFQPMEGLNDFLSLADVHIVLQSQLLEGILHPSKVYNALALGRPVLFLGPLNNFFAPLLEQYKAGWYFPITGDEETLKNLLVQIIQNPVDLALRKQEALRLASQFQRETITGQFHSLINSGTQR
jgi:hypothetical protein